jgi:hypothetical protein
MSYGPDFFFNILTAFADTIVISLANACIFIVDILDYAGYSRFLYLLCSLSLLYVIAYYCDLYLDFEKPPVTPTPMSAMKQHATLTYSVTRNKVACDKYLVAPLTPTIETKGRVAFVMTDPVPLEMPLIIKNLTLDPKHNFRFDIKKAILLPGESYRHDLEYEVYTNSANAYGLLGTQTEVCKSGVYNYNERYTIHRHKTDQNITVVMTRKIAKNPDIGDTFSFKNLVFICAGIMAFTSMMGVPIIFHAFVMGAMFIFYKNITDENTYCNVIHNQFNVVQENFEDYHPDCNPHACNSHRQKTSSKQPTRIYTNRKNDYSQSSDEENTDDEYVFEGDNRSSRKKKDVPDCTSTDKQRRSVKTAAAEKEKAAQNAASTSK